MQPVFSERTDFKTPHTKFSLFWTTLSDTIFTIYRTELEI